MTDYTYSLIYNSPSVQRSDGSYIPADDRNVDWQQYQEWLALGNIPTPVDISIYKTNQTNKISSACGESIVSGFFSNALGSLYQYPCDSNTQANITNLSLSGANGSVWCGNSPTNWNFVPHTPTQLKHLHLDMILHIQTNQTKFSELLIQIQDATTPEAVQAINW